LDLAQQHSASNEMGLESDSDYEDAEDVDSEALLSPWTQSFEELRELMIKINEFMHKRTTREGHVDRDVVPDKARVSVRYSFYWEGMGSPFDSSMLRGTKFEFETGQKAVVMGLEAAVLTMRPYEQAEFIISYKLLFGELGCPPRIKPMADALLKVEVIDYSLIGDAEAINGIPKEDRDKFCVVYPKAQDMHLHAKDCVKRGRYRDAASTFERAINYQNKTLTTANKSSRGANSNTENERPITSAHLPTSEGYENHPVSNLREDPSSTYHPQRQAANAFQVQIGANLEVIDSNLSVLKMLANELGGEIESQNELLDNLNHKIEDVDLQIQKQNQDLTKLLKK